MSWPWNPQVAARAVISWMDGLHAWIDRCKMTEVRDTEKLSSGDKRVIAKFWDKNDRYEYDSGSKVKADDSYRLFIEVYPGRNVSKASFIGRAQCLGVKDK